MSRQNRCKKRFQNFLLLTLGLIIHNLNKISNHSLKINLDLVAQNQSSQHKIRGLLFNKKIKMILGLEVFLKNNLNRKKVNNKSLK